MLTRESAGELIVCFAFDATVEVHPSNKDATLHLTIPTGEPDKVIVMLFGGKGTINVPSRSPDSARLAFGSYRLVRT